MYDIDRQYPVWFSDLPNLFMDAGHEAREPELVSDHAADEHHISFIGAY
jgi:hypothetical protein